MKCIKCGTDNKLKDRTATGGRCTQCRHPFVFDPKATGSGINFTDGFFATTLQKLSVNNTLFFTPKQLYYFFNNRKQSTFTNVMGCGCVLLILGPVMIGAAFITKLWVFAIIGAVLLICGILAFKPTIRERFEEKKPKKIVFEPNQVEDWVRKWSRVNGSIEKLLTPIALPKKKTEISPEIKSYSFDRLLVCERASVAQFLIANNFHFEHNCAVLSFDKYPQDIFDTVMEMLSRNPSLNVYALHNASPTGVQLTHWLRTDPSWFKDRNVAIHDLGLMPRQAFDRKLFVETSEGSARLVRESMPPEVRATLLPEEIKWLEAGNYVDLQSFTPAALLRIVTMGIAKSRDPNATNALADTESDVYYAGGPYIFMYDNFG